MKFSIKKTGVPGTDGHEFVTSIINADSKHIATVQDNQYATLFAAAPELLAALIAITNLYDTDEGCRSLPEYINARAAISKATGKTDGA